MKKNLLSLTFILCFVIGAAAQSTKHKAILQDLGLYAFVDAERMYHIGDSLLHVARQNSDKELEGAVFLEYGNNQYFFSNYSAADSFYQQVEKLTSALPDRHVYNKARVRRAIIYADTGSAYQGRQLMKELAQEFRREGDNFNLVYAVNSIANLSVDLNQRDSAFYYFTEALEISKTDGGNYEYAFTLNNLALYLLDDGDYDGALANLTEGYKYATKANEVRLKATIIANMGLVNLYKRNDTEAITCFKLLIKIGQQTKANKYGVIGHINLGSMYLRTEQMAESKMHLDSAKLLCIRDNDVMTLPTVYVGIGNWHLRSDSFEKAIEYAELVLESSEKRDVLEPKLQAHSLAAAAYDSLGMYKEALEQHRKLKEVSDEINESTNQNLLAQFQARYQLSEAEAKYELAQTQNELDAARFRIITIGGGGLVLVIFAFLYVRHLRLTRKQKARFAQNLISSVETERGRIAKDLHDDVGQTLSMIKNKVNTSNLNDQDQTELDNALQHVIEQTREISRNLYPGYLRKVGLKNALSTLVNNVEQHSDLTSSVEIDDVDEQLTDEQKTHLYRIVQECINNTLKHAKATALKVSLLKDNSELHLLYQDNGIGISYKNKSTGLGMMSIAERVQILDGDLSISNNRGSGVRIFIKFRVQTLA